MAEEDKILTGLEIVCCCSCLYENSFSSVRTSYPKDDQNNFSLITIKITNQLELDILPSGCYVILIYHCQKSDNFWSENEMA